MAEDNFWSKHVFSWKKSNNTLITQEICEYPASKEAEHLMRDSHSPSFPTAVREP